MKFSESAVAAILKVMTGRGLNPQTTFLEIGVFEGNLGMGFTRESLGKIFEFGSLRVIVANNVDTTGIVVDFGEVAGKKGLVFLGEENGNHVNGTST